MCDSVNLQQGSRIPIPVAQAASQREAANRSGESIPEGESASRAGC